MANPNENDPRQGTEYSIEVTSEDPEKKKKKPKDSDKSETYPEPPKANGQQPQQQPNEEEELSEEDANLKGELEMLVQRLKENDISLHRSALETLRTLIRTATSSMTSVPKPLKFLRPHYDDLKAIHASWPDPPASSTDDIPDKHLFADILSVLAMTYSDTGKRETLKYRLTGGSSEDPGNWGNEYVRHLAAEIGEENAARREKGISDSNSDLYDLAMRVVQFFLRHNGEADAVDVLAELDSINSIVDEVDENSFPRVCLYIVSCVPLLTPPDDAVFLRTAIEIYRKFHRRTESLVLALRLNDDALVREIFDDPTLNPTMRRQLGYILARHPVGFEGFESEDEELVNILHQRKLSEYFRSFAKTLEIMDPKSPEDIYKTHLEPFKTQLQSGVNPVRQNLASTFVNAFVNAGFGNDQLMVGAPEGSSWVYKNKGVGMLSATASLGMSLLWDTEEGLSHVDRYTYSEDPNIKAGALLGTGIMHSGVRDSMDIALSLLREDVENENETIKTCSILGLGIAHAGLRREEEMFTQRFHEIISDSSNNIQIVAMTALSLAFVYVGSSNGDISELLLQAMMERSSADLESMWGRYLALALGLIFLGRQEQSEVAVMALKTMPEPFSKQAIVLCEMCAYAGTGNVLKIQELLRNCMGHLDSEKDNDLFQSFSVIGIALIAMGEDVGSEMALRQMNHLMHYGEPDIRAGVPLALALLSISNPATNVVDTLSKYSHDNDGDVACRAVFAMGLVGAGTTNARLSQLLRQLAGYWHKDDDLSFTVRLAQGMVHMGKGIIGLNPYHSDRSVMSPTAVAGILTTVIAMTDAKRTILDQYHYFLYFLSMSMHPRFLVTLDSEGEPINTTVRVGQAVDTVGQAGKPRTITGFQTHKTPVRLATTERAELGTEEFIPYSHALEGVVILAKNEAYEKDDMDTR